MLYIGILICIKINYLKLFKYIRYKKRKEIVKILKKITSQEDIKEREFIENFLKVLSED